MPRRAAALALVLLAACARISAERASALPPLPAFVSESTLTDTVAPGVVHRFLWAARGPWAIHILDVDRAACWSVTALKAGGRAVGRERTSELVRAFSGNARGAVAGGVNADFFSFEPPGVPIGPHVSAGRVIAGPWTRPVLAFDSAGVPAVTTLAARGLVVIGSEYIPLDAWNQRRVRGVALFDAAWGPTTDTASGVLEVTLSGDSSRVVGLDTATAGVAIPRRGVVVVFGRAAAERVRRTVFAMPLGAQARWAVSLEPFHPRDAVGGFPVLLGDSVLAPDLDSAGGANFGPVRHPRTAVGIAAGGRRLLLVTVDGRQAPYSDGMTLRELAELFRTLGAVNAINLDGGGSTTMVVRRGDGTYAVANRPSDREGERSVANALAVERRCGRGR